jgi:hypothetical protein
MPAKAAENHSFGAIRMDYEVVANARLRWETFSGAFHSVEGV